MYVGINFSSINDLKSKNSILIFQTLSHDSWSQKYKNLAEEGYFNQKLDRFQTSLGLRFQLTKKGLSSVVHLFNCMIPEIKRPLEKIFVLANYL